MTLTPNAWDMTVIWESCLTEWSFFYSFGVNSEGVPWMLVNSAFRSMHVIYHHEIAEIPVPAHRFSTHTHSSGACQAITETKMTVEV